MTTCRTTTQRAGLLAAVVATLAPCACNEGQAAHERAAPAATKSGASPAQPGVLPKEALRYIKTEEAHAGTDTGITAATGKIAFNEDRTSRVATPLSGRVQEILV